MKTYLQETIPVVVMQNGRYMVRSITGSRYRMVINVRVEQQNEK